jgi:tetratricopeptide (TPR) repeat protein
MNMIGVCYRNIRNYNDALIIINKAISIKPDPHFYLNRSYCYNGLNDKEPAKKDALIAKQSGLEIEIDVARSLGIQ